MASNSNIVQLMKRAAIEAVDASKPCIIKLGRVKSVSPLKISLGQKITVDESFLYVTKTARDIIKKTETRVVLLRQQGGGKYLVLDVLD